MIHRTSVAVLGSGNIGTDLFVKLQQDPAFEVVMVAGIDPASEGLCVARAHGCPTSTDGLAGLLSAAQLPEIVFDCTFAGAHRDHAAALGSRGVRLIDLTPAAIGPMVIPAVNLPEHLDAANINMVSCAAQATVPMVHALSVATGNLDYAETVTTIASRSAGPGTRQNIDEFTHKTSRVLERIGGARRGKAIAILNPAEPPLMMRNTVYGIAGAPYDEAVVSARVAEAAEAVQRYVPGYRFLGPTFSGSKITVFTEIEGAGDYLPAFAGNLDIMTAAAVEVARALVGTGLPALPLAVG